MYRMSHPAYSLEQKTDFEPMLFFFFFFLLSVAAKVNDVFFLSLLKQKSLQKVRKVTIYFLFSVYIIYHLSTYLDNIIVYFIVSYLLC